MNDFKIENNYKISLKDLFPDLYHKYPEYITKAQAAEIFKVSAKTISEWQKQGKLPPPKFIKGLGHRHHIKLDDVLIFLLEKNKRQEIYKLYQKELKEYYDKKYKSYPDLLFIKDIAALTGYNEKTVYSWVSGGYLKGYFGGAKYKIPKKYLITFLCGPHYQCRARISNIQKEDTHKFIIGLFHNIPSEILEKGFDEVNMI